MAPRTLIGNAFRQGFYWPTAVADANEVVRTCEGCQFYARKTNLLAHALQTILVTWPFAVWALDIIRPLRKVPGGYTHLLVAVDKFSKWIEAHPIRNLRAEQAVSFITDIIHGSECRIPSSPTTTANLLAGNSWSFATNTTSVGDSHKGPIITGENPFFANNKNTNELTNRKMHPTQSRPGDGSPRP
jgi:hypothetical protein